MANGAAVALAGYSLAIAPAVALLLGVLAVKRRTRATSTTAVVVFSLVVWVALVVPPAIGYLADSISSPRACGSGEECYDFIRWWLAVPVGWVAAGLVVIAGRIVGGRPGSGVVDSVNPRLN